MSEARFAERGARSAHSPPAADLARGEGTPNPGVVARGLGTVRPGVAALIVAFGLLGWILAACADGASEAHPEGIPASEEDRPAVGEEEAEGEAEPPTPEPPRPGGAILDLEDDRFELAVVRCALEGEVDDARPTLETLGSFPGGELRVTATRERFRGSLIHTVRVEVVDPGLADPPIHEATRTFGLGAWTSLRGGPEEALIRIQGDRLRAEGRFGPLGDMDAPALDGRLDARCPPEAP